MSLPALMRSTFRERDLGRAKPLEPDGADIARVKEFQAGAGAAGDELTGPNTALFTPDIRQHDGDAERIASRVATHLIQPAFAVHTEA